MDLIKVKEQMVKSQKIIADERDILRDLYGEIDHLVLTFDEADENLEISVIELDLAIEKLSEIV